MPVIPSAVERIVLRLGMAPAPVLDIAAGTGLRTVSAAAREGLFDALAAGPLTAHELAERRGYDAERVRMWLEHLVSLGYIEERRGGYRNTRVARTWLVSTSPQCIGPWLRLWDEVVLAHGWTDLGAFARGRRFDLYRWLDEHPEHWPLAQDAFRAVARLNADGIAARIVIPAHARVVDVGGGHGLYTVALLRRYREARATIFDLERPLEAAVRTLADAPDVAGRIDLRSGDILREDPGSGFDAALLFNVIHGFPPDSLAIALARTRAALAPGGRIFVLDQFARSALGPATRAVRSLLALNYGLVLGGRTYTVAEVTAQLRDAGFSRPRRITTLTSDIVEATAG